ncbi:hypothetical protein AOPFMNJM_3676 [Methylobacterium jeotgali]|uniref:RNA polymerase subunit sigma-24 n=3 Tax=Methylobacteriaceae TaxID=119045 RepID=A0ABQ4SYQ2_9HYPH|nr:hypothetical protein AOPFMNJM_3676 [Methylobacterium jeotgali]
MCRARSGGDGFEGMIAICLARGGPAPASALGDPGLQGRAPSRMRRGTGAGMREDGQRATDRAASGPDAAMAADMAAAQGGDAQAYRRLLRACAPVIARVARGQGLRGEAVEDVVQDTLVTLHRARASYDPARPFLPWLGAIARRRSVDALRRGGRQPREVHDPAAYEGEADPAPGPGMGIEARERSAHLRRAVAALPQGQREAVEHLALRERSLDEAARLTGRSKGALKVNLHRALKALRGALSGERERGDV